MNRQCSIRPGWSARGVRGGWVITMALAYLLTGCSLQSVLLRTAADELAQQGGAAEEDLGLARDAGAFYLKLSESVLARTPGHLALAEAVSGGFTQYSYAFVEFEADRIESSDVRAAQRLRQRAAALYWRAHRHAMAALELHRPGIGLALVGAAADATAVTARSLDPVVLLPEHVGLAYWAAASWGAAIALSKHKPDVVADLPRAVALARMAWQVAPDHGQGALASLMGSFAAAAPGADRREVLAYFEQAIAAGKGAAAGPYLAMAETIALADGDRAGFETWLRQAIHVATKYPVAGNQIMGERARWLLATADDRF